MGTNTEAHSWAMYRQCKTFISFFWSFGGIYLFHFMIINSYHSIIILLKVINNSWFTYCWLYNLFRSWSFPFPIPCQILPTSLPPYQPNFLFFLSFSQTHPTSWQSTPPKKNNKKPLKTDSLKKNTQTKQTAHRKHGVLLFSCRPPSPGSGVGLLWGVVVITQCLSTGENWFSLSQQESIAQSFLVRGVVPSLPFPFRLSVLGFGLVWTCAGLCALPQLLWVQRGTSPAVPEDSLLGVTPHWGLLESFSSSYSQLPEP